MSKQLGFYLINEDYDKIMDFINKSDAVIYRRYNKVLPPNAIHNLNEENANWMYCIVLIEKVNQLKFIERRLTDGLYYEIDTQSSPVIEINKSICDNNCIRRGRVYFQTEFYNDNKKLIKSDTKTVALGNSLINFIKKDFIKLDGIYKSYYSSYNIINSSYTLVLN